MPPTTMLGSRPADSSSQAISDVVVVFPCVPATTMECFPLMKSWSIASGIDVYGRSSSSVPAASALVDAAALLTALTASLTFAADQPAKAKKTAAPAAKKAEAAKVAEKAPRLTIVEPVKDYGTIAKGEKLDWSFLVKNTGDADLQIISAKPGCGCTVADFDKVIKPGETGKVTAHVDTTAFAGPIAKTITLETNDPTTPTSQLTIP